VATTNNRGKETCHMKVKTKTKAGFGSQFRQ